MFDLEDFEGNIFPRRVYPQEIREAKKDDGHKIARMKKLFEPRRTGKK